LVRGYFSAYDSASDKVYFINPGNGSPESTQFGADVWVLDLTTGTTSSFLDLDDSISLFTSASTAPFGDKVAAFTLGPAANADFDGNGIVNGNDFLIWQKNLGSGNSHGTGDANGDGLVNAADLAVWKTQYGTSPAAAAAASVPEPAAAVLALCGVALIAGNRRRN
jgi:hypothetical protein